MFENRKKSHFASKTALEFRTILGTKIQKCENLCSNRIKLTFEMRQFWMVFKHCGEPLKTLSKH